MKPNSRNIVFCFALLMIFALLLCGCDWRTYGKAKDALKLGDFEKAFELLETIPNYTDKDNIRDEVTYGYALSLAKRKRYEEAVALYERIPEYKDSQKLLKDTYLGWAEKLTVMGDFNKAMDIYKKIGEEDRLTDTLLEKGEALIRDGKFEAAYDTLRSLDNNPKAMDLQQTAKRGALYLQGMAALTRNDMRAARQKFGEAVKIKSEGTFIQESEYLTRYCASLLPLVKRLGAEGKNEEVLRALMPIQHKIADMQVEDCAECMKVLNLVKNRYFYKETLGADWHQKIDQYRKKFEDPSARCNAYGNLISYHLKRTKRLVTVLEFMEQIGSECNDVPALDWDETKRTVELNLSTMTVNWKQAKNYKKIILIQKYISSKLKDLNLEIGSWDILQEKDLKPKYKLTQSEIGDGKYMITGWVKNPSNYRPLIVKGISADCANNQTNKVTADCAFGKSQTRILPQGQAAVSVRIRVPGNSKVVETKVKAEFEDVNITEVTAKDLFAKETSY